MTINRSRIATYGWGPGQADERFYRAFWGFWSESWLVHVVKQITLYLIDRILGLVLIDRTLGLTLHKRRHDLDI